MSDIEEAILRVLPKLVQIQGELEDICEQLEQLEGYPYAGIQHHLEEILVQLQERLPSIDDRLSSLKVGDILEQSTES